MAKYLNTKCFQADRPSLHFAILSTKSIDDKKTKDSLNLFPLILFSLSYASLRSAPWGFYANRKSDVIALAEVDPKGNQITNRMKIITENQE